MSLGEIWQAINAVVLATEQGSKAVEAEGKLSRQNVASTKQAGGVAHNFTNWHSNYKI